MPTHQSKSPANGYKALVGKIAREIAELELFAGLFSHYQTNSQIIDILLGKKTIDFFTKQCILFIRKCLVSPP